MKKIIYILSIILCAGNTYAQEAPKSLKNEVGINMVTFMDLAFFKNNEDVFNNFGGFSLPSYYQNSVNYKSHITDRLAFRSGFGFFQNTQRDSSVSTFANTRSKRIATDITVFMGYQKNYHLDTKFLVYSGLDFIFKHRYIGFFNREEFNGFFPQIFETKNKTNKYQLGFGIPLGTQYYFSKRISISTELNVEFLYGQTIEENDSSNQPTPNTGPKRRQVNINFNAPIALFINYRF